MTYKEALDFMYSSLPMYHRTGKAAYKANLDNSLILDRHTSHPHRTYRTIHIAGTNGKGSVASMLASILQEAGYSTGLFTSPHLRDFRERIRVDGEMIPENAVICFLEKYMDVITEIQPSFFEMNVALAFDYFRQRHIDIGVIETGLGGRLDSTNIISPLVSVITNISADHTDLLGTTPEDIAFEKAGIIKRHIPVVIGETQTDSGPVFIRKAQETGTDISFADQEYSCISFEIDSDNFTHPVILKQGLPVYEGLVCELTGQYQRKNILTVLRTIDYLKKKGIRIHGRDVFQGLKRIRQNTGFAGRWHILQRSPMTICDTGHNPAGIREVIEQLMQTPHAKLHIVLGLVNDKDAQGILSVLPKNAVYYFTQASVPRALPAGELLSIGEDAGLSGKSFTTVSEALSAARTAAMANDLVFVGGSTFVVAEVV